MTLSEYRNLVEGLPFGKRLHSAVYVYADEAAAAGLGGLGERLDSLVSQLRAAYRVGPEFNVLKFRTDELKVSFLCYPEFVTQAHPALAHAITVDLGTGRARHMDYRDKPNPPILHRKESFPPADHPLRANFEALTRAEEEAGLYVETATIGFKLNWEKLLQVKELTIHKRSVMRPRAGTPFTAGKRPNAKPKS